MHDTTKSKIVGPTVAIALVVIYTTYKATQTYSHAQHAEPEYIVPSPTTQAGVVVLVVLLLAVLLVTRRFANR